MDLLTVAQHDDHRRLALHLLLVIEVLGVGSFGGWKLLAAAARAFASFHGGLIVVGIVIVAVKGRPDQLAIRESFLFHYSFRWHGIDCFLHGTPPVHPHPGRRPQHLAAVHVGMECELCSYRSTGMLR